MDTQMSDCASPDYIPFVIPDFNVILTINPRPNPKLTPESKQSAAEHF